MKAALIFTIGILITAGVSSCRKESRALQYSIRGTLLESTSRPVPVGNYKLQAVQRNDYGLFGGVAGISEEFETDASGNFVLRYTPRKGTGFNSGSPNSYPIALSGIDTVKYKGLYPDWYPITANKDTVLNTIYLYKQIDQFVRKLTFNAALAAGDSLKVITMSAYRSIYKTLYGPIAAGTVLTLEPINQLKAERLDISSNSYTTSTVLKKPFYQQDFGLMLPVGDEAYREQLLVYEP